MYLLDSAEFAIVSRCAGTKCSDLQPLSAQTWVNFLGSIKRRLLLTRLSTEVLGFCV